MIRRHFDKWARKKLSTDHEQSYGVNQVFCFFNSEGGLYIVLIIITFIVGVNYANNLALALSFLLFSIAILSFYLASKQILKLKLAMETADLAQVGEEFIIKLTVTPKLNNKHFHLRFIYQSQYKKISLLNQPTVIQFVDIPKYRGRYQLERVQLMSVYPFGIVKAWSFFYFSKEIWVAPQPLPIDLQKFGLNAQADEQQMGMEDFSHLREFQQGDALNRVAWQQFAKGRGLLIKQFEQHQQHELVFDYYQMPASLHEEKLSQLMTLVENAFQHDYPFCLILPSKTLPLGVGQTQYYQAKLMLAQEP